MRYQVDADTVRDGFLSFVGNCTSESLSMRARAFKKVNVFEFKKNRDGKHLSNIYLYCHLHLNVFLESISDLFLFLFYSFPGPKKSCDLFLKQ